MYETSAVYVAYEQLLWEWYDAEVDYAQSLRTGSALESKITSLQMEFNAKLAAFKEMLSAELPSY